MTAKEMIEELSKFPPDTEVLITDGYASLFYRGHYCFAEWKAREKTAGPLISYCEIGIGGCEDDIDD